LEVETKRGNKVYVVILNYNCWTDMIECLESVLRNDYPNYQVIVVDNDSPNNSMDYIKKWAEGKSEAWVNPKYALRYLSYSLVNKPISLEYYQISIVKIHTASFVEFLIKSSAIKVTGFLIKIFLKIML